MMTGNQPEKLSQSTLEQAVLQLCRIDRHLNTVINRHGSPPLWDRPAGFATLLHIILEQQVSLASANAAFSKLKAAAGHVTPESFLRISEDELRLLGFSRQKSSYGRGLAQMILDGELDLDELGWLGDEEVRKRLIAVKGIGPWTADIYLMEVLLRPDIWPVGDLALAKGMQKVKLLPELPSAEQQHEISTRWKPWRAVAARIIWHNYLSEGR